MEPSGKDDGAKRGVLCVKLPSDQSLYYIDEDTVLKNVKERGYADDSSLKQVAHSDLTPGVYEGMAPLFSTRICEVQCRHLLLT